MDEKALWKAAGQRLAEARTRAGFATQKAFAQAVELSGPTIAKYEQGVREIPLALLFWLSDRYGINGNWVITGAGEVVADYSKLPKPPVVVDTATVQQLSAKIDRVSQAIGSMRQGIMPSETIKYLPLQASAGGGALVLDEPVGIDMDMDMLAENLLGVRRKNILLLEIKGDSMEPTLLDKDVVIVDAGDPKPNDDPDEDKVYVVSIEGELFAKRARWTDSGGLLWCSDNERYTPISVTGEDFNRIKTVGRLTWVWRPV